MQRRSLFKLGLAGAAVLALAGGGLALVQPGVLASGRLAPAGREVFAAVARAVLDGSLPRPTDALEQALQAHLERLDTTIAGFPAPVRKELSDLLALLATAPGRLGFAGLRSPWPEASVGEIQAALQSMRLSALALRQQAYHALRDLTNAAFYADAGAWPLLHYPGPRAV